MAVEITVKERFLSHKGNLDQLKEFVRQAEDHGLNEFTWTAYPGDQREPGELILTARRATR